jgi:tetratricopeptide (TPR) repeat protein
MSGQPGTLTRADACFQHAVAAVRENRRSDAITCLRDALAADSGHARAHRLLGLLLRDQGRLSDALACLDTAIACQPDLNSVHGERGDLLMDLGRHRDAVASYDRALALDPGSFGDWLNRGAALCELRGFDQAVESFGKAIALKPDFPRAYFNRGNALAALAQFEAAIADYNRALSLDPGLVDALINRGNALRSLNRHLDALASYESALKLNAHSASALANAASALLPLGRHAEAVDKYNQAIAVDPDFLEARHNLGNALAKLDRHEAAVEQYLAVLAVRPDDWKTRLNLAHSLLSLGQPERAIDHCKAVLEHEPGFPEAHFNLACVLKALARYQEAAAAFQRAIDLKPEYYDAYDGLGLVLGQLDQPSAARAAFDRALSLMPDSPQTALNKGLLLLSRGHFAEGWPLMEHRWAAHHAPRRSFPQPRWSGDSIDGRLLIWGDQGLGEQIIYASMIAELIDKATELVVEVEPRLVSLFARSFPRARVAALDIATHSGSIDRQECLSDVGRHLRHDWADFPRSGHGYLKPDEKRVQAFRAELGAGERKVVGLSWVSRNKRYGGTKTAQLRDFEPLLRPNTCFVDLQYGNTEQERHEIERDLGVSIKRLPTLDTTIDIDGLAALIAACDAVVSVSNTTAHLAGAVGQRTWVVVPHGEARFWYWFKGDGNSPWYPRVRVRSQRPGQAWSDVISGAAQELIQELIQEPI